MIQTFLFVWFFSPPIVLYIVMTKWLQNFMLFNPVWNHKDWPASSPVARAIVCGGAQGIIGWKENAELLNHRLCRLKSLLMMEGGLHHLETRKTTLTFSSCFANLRHLPIAPHARRSSLVPLSAETIFTPCPQYRILAPLRVFFQNFRWTPPSFLYGNPPGPEIQTLLRESKAVGSVNVDFLTNFTGHWGVFEGLMQILREVQDVIFPFQQFIQNWEMKKLINWFRC